MSPPVKQKIDALDRGLVALDLIAAQGPLTLAELARQLDVSRATAFRMLATLQGRGFVEHDKVQHAYRLGAAVNRLHARTGVAELETRAESVLRSLRDETRETVNLAIVHGDKLVYHRILEGPQAMRMSGTPGAEAPWHSTALGMAVLSHLDAEEARELCGPEPYTAYTPHTARDWKHLSARLQSALKAGYSTDEQEMDVGATCIAAAILDRTERPVAAISMAGLAARWEPKERKRIGRLLRDAAEGLSGV
jgi:IclR family transcriptional regulator, acetate operon repressor